MKKSKLKRKALKGQKPSRYAGKKIVVWFSCGNNSAVAAKMTLERFPEAWVRVVRCVVPEEHPDNDRFSKDIEKWLGVPIEFVSSTKYRNCNEVWIKRSYMSGIKGAPCTGEMKKIPRHDFEKVWHPDYHVFGFSSDEAHRSIRFLANNPEIRLLRPLEKAGITKPMCKDIIKAAGIKPAVMYVLGFANNNCIGCVKATSIAYWARIRHYFPKEFKQRADLSRKLKVRLTRLKGVRIFLDEIPKDYDWRKKDRSGKVECGVTCPGS